MLCRRNLALMLGALAVLVVAGCGGGNGSMTTQAESDTTTGSIPKAEFVKRANGLCEQAQERLHSGFEALINEKAQRSRTKEEEEWVNRVIAPNIKRNVQEIRGLGMPKGGEGHVEALFAAIESGLNTLEEKPEEVLASSQKVFSEAIKLADEYDLKTCAQTY